MKFRRFGGWLILGGGALVGIAVWMYLEGDGLGFGSANLTGLVLDGALTLFGAGAIVLAAVGVAPAPLNDRLGRVGLAILGVGQLTLLAVSILAAIQASVSPGTIPTWLLLDFVGAVAAGLGLLLTGIAIVQTPGRGRLVGGLLLLGSLLLAGLAIATAVLRLELPSHSTLWAIVVAIGGNVGVGLLAVAGFDPPQNEAA